MEDHVPTGPGDRALGGRVWGRKAAVLPDKGTLLVATDLQGNRGDYERLKQIYWEEDRAGNDPVLAFCGDMVHGPSPDLNEPGAWPIYLGSPYVDHSAEILADFEQFTRYARGFSLVGNHEHAHIGGPVVAKFYDDEAAILDERLGTKRQRMHDFMRSFPLIAVAPCGVVLTHGAPMATEEQLEDFESLHFDGYESTPTYQMLTDSTVGALLWSRSATTEQAEALLQATSLDGAPNAFVAYGHDIVPSGYEKVGPRQICVSTSFGVHNATKVYLRLDLSARYDSVEDLRPNHEIRQLYG